MNISELKENWEEVKERITGKFPWVICVFENSDISVEDNKVWLEFKEQDEIFKRIAERYLVDIYAGICDFIESDFKLETRLVENGEA